MVYFVLGGMIQLYPTDIDKNVEFSNKISLFDRHAPMVTKVLIPIY